MNNLTTVSCFVCGKRLTHIQDWIVELIQTGKVQGVVCRSCGKDD